MTPSPLLTQMDRPMRNATSWIPKHDEEIGYLLCRCHCHTVAEARPRTYEAIVRAVVGVACRRHAVFRDSKVCVAFSAARYEANCKGTCCCFTPLPCRAHLASQASDLPHGCAYSVMSFKIPRKGPAASITRAHSSASRMACDIASSGFRSLSDASR